MVSGEGIWIEYWQHLLIPSWTAFVAGHFRDGWLSELIYDCLGTRCMGKDLENLRTIFLRQGQELLHFKSCLLIMVLKVIEMMEHDREQRTETWSTGITFATSYCHLIKGVTSHHFWHIILVKSKSQVLCTLRGRRVRKGVNSGSRKSLGVTLGPVCHRYK